MTEAIDLLVAFGGVCMSAPPPSPRGRGISATSVRAALNELKPPKPVALFYRDPLVSLATISVTVFALGALLRIALS